MEVKGIFSIKEDGFDEDGNLPARVVSCTYDGDVNYLQEQKTVPKLNIHYVQFQHDSGDIRTVRHRLLESVLSRCSHMLFITGFTPATPSDCSGLVSPCSSLGSHLLTWYLRDSFYTTCCLKSLRGKPEETLTFQVNLVLKKTFKVILLEHC